MSSIWNSFDGIEIHTVCMRTDHDGERIAEPVHGADTWNGLRDEYGCTFADLSYGVYGHLKIGGIECLCDCATPESARAIARSLATVHGYNTYGENGVVDCLYDPAEEEKRRAALATPRPPLDVLRALVALVEAQRMPLRMDEGDPKAHNAKSTDYFGEFQNYYDDSDLSRERAAMQRDMGGYMVVNGSVRICWPELAALIDEANASINRFGATTASI